MSDKNMNAQNADLFRFIDRDEISSEKMHRDASVRPSVQDAGRRNCAGAGPAGPGLAASPFPDAHADILSVLHADKLRVDSLRKERMMFKIRSHFL